MPDTDTVVVVGSGPAGLGFANHIQKDFILFEAEDQPGGLMRSKSINGYIFDWAGHIFFTNIPRIRSWVETLLNENLHWQDRESWVFSKSVYTRYPFQANTFGLPIPIVKECLMGLIEATYRIRSMEPAHFQEWILETYGQGIADHFMLPYNEKLWARDISTMDHHWLSGRVPRPGLSEFIDGALGPGRKDMGPNARFGYPLHGGTKSLVDKLTASLGDKLKLNMPIVSIDPVRKCVTTGDGSVVSYKSLILTNPLPQIIAMTNNIPESIQDTTRDLEYISVLCVNVGVHRPNITPKHWIYFPEPEFLFHRIFVQGNASPHVCPNDCFSYTAEITYNSKKKVNQTTAGEQTIQGLAAAGLLRSDDPIDVIDLIDIPVGYVVPTHDRKKIVSRIREWYGRHDIHLLGRFAEWEYYNMDHALDAGWQLADELSGTI